MGVVVQSGYNAPDVDSIRVVREDYTVPGKVGGWILDDHGSGARGDFSAWRLEEPDFPVIADGEALLLPGTTLAYPERIFRGLDWDPTIVNVFKIDLPVVYKADFANLKPQLTGPNDYESSGYPRHFSSVRVPFTLVSDPERPTHWKVANSPFYYIRREEDWVGVQSFDNTGEGGTGRELLEYGITTGYTREDSDKFTREVGIKVSVESGVSFLGTGGKVEVEVSTKLGWETQTSHSYSTSTYQGYHVGVDPFQYVQILQAQGGFRTIDGTGTTRQVGYLPMKSNNVLVLRYIQKE